MESVKCHFTLSSSRDAMLPIRIEVSFRTSIMSLIDFCALDGNPNNVVPPNVNIVSMRSEHHSCCDTPNGCQWLISNLLVVLLKRHQNHMLDLPAKRRSSSIANVNSLTIFHRESFLKPNNQLQSNSTLSDTLAQHN
uniref:Uncharacterized protein n=1 Tax=Glossina austeni TaxID=7395 RepID=A0A1A9VAT8_GLOAU